MPTHHVTCPLCEATCGLAITVSDGEKREVTSVRGDARDVFSGGYLCPKGASIGAVHADPDRLRTPLVKRDGRFAEASWEEAYAAIAAGMAGLRGDAVAVYLGNPGVHNLSTALYGRVLLKALGTKNIYTASSVDQAPKQFAAGHMFGDPMTVAVPDLDRTDFLLLLGANPLVSNGSLMTAPDVRGRLRAIRARGGRIVVVDPMRSRTAELADEHLAIRPGGDALLLFALVHVLFADGLADLGGLADVVAGVDEVRALAADFTPEAVAPATGLPAEAIRRLAHELAAAPSAAVYGRIGTTTQRFGSLASWLVDVLNTLTGNLDRPGGAMFPLAAAGQANSGPGRKPFRHGRWRSRVRGLPEVMGELPAATLADEIATPGDGQVRALITLAGNPCVSTPNADRLAEALRGLDFMVSVDVYLNETTRHADVILPGTSPLERAHYDIALYQFAVRNVANWSDAVLATDVPQEWETLLRLTAALTGQSTADIDAMDTFVAEQSAARFGVPVAENLRGPERLLAMLLAAGPYDLTLDDLRAQPHGVDLGPLAPRLPGALSTASGKVELAPPALTADVPRLVAELAAAPAEMVLIGRRNLRSNNSWMHNIAPLVGGQNRCTALVHPLDAQRLDLADGGACVVRSRTGKLTVPVEVTDAVRPGVISIPHGWGHGLPDTRGSVAADHAGVNSNVLADEQLVDAPTGTAVLNGIPVEVTRA